MRCRATNSFSDERFSTNRAFDPRTPAPATTETFATESSHDHVQPGTVPSIVGSSNPGLTSCPPKAPASQPIAAAAISLHLFMWRLRFILPYSVSVRQTYKPQTRRFRNMFSVQLRRSAPKRVFQVLRGELREAETEEAYQCGQDFAERRMSRMRTAFRVRRDGG